MLKANADEAVSFDLGQRFSTCAETRQPRLVAVDEVRSARPPDR
jgi:hypothetical protein